VSALHALEAIALGVETVLVIAAAGLVALLLLAPRGPRRPR
jgi:hypothetical protein